MKNVLQVFLLLVVMFSSMGVYAQSSVPGKALKGKNIGVIGDSYVRNHVEPVENTWHYKFAQKYGMNYFNYGLNGNSIAYSSDRWGEALYLRYATMKDSLDYVVVIAGHNDCFKLDSLQHGIDTFKERMASLCEGLIARYPTANIIFFTRWNCEGFKGSDSEKVVNAMIEACHEYSIPILDCVREGGIFAQDETFRTIYFQSLDDNAHLNAKGHDRFFPVAENFILRY